VPKRLPDGLVEAELTGQDRPIPFLIEIAAFPETRAMEQALAEIAMVYMDRGELPEVVVLVLHPKGQVTLEDHAERTSRLGWTTLAATWHVRYLWTIAATDLLAMNDVGIIPLVPLSRIDGPPDEVLRQCGERIEQQAPGNERANLLAVTQILTQMRYNEKRLLDLLGGRQAMIDSPLIQELLDDPEVVRTSRALQELLADPQLVRTSPAFHGLVTEATTEALLKQRREDILGVLQERFGAVPAEILAALQGLTDQPRLKDLMKWAFRCPDINAFRQRLEVTPDRPSS
jgi:hypothetical protein